MTEGLDDKMAHSRTLPLNNRRAGRWLTLALAVTLFGLAAFASAGGYLAYRASTRVASAIRLNEAYDRARFALVSQEAHKHEYLSELLPELLNELDADRESFADALTELEV